MQFLKNGISDMTVLACPGQDSQRPYLMSNVRFSHAVV